MAFLFGVGALDQTIAQLFFIRSSHSFIFSMLKPILSPLASGQGFFQAGARTVGRRGTAFLLGLGLLGAAPAALAQAPTIYGLGTVTTNAIPGGTTGQQGIIFISPTNGAPISPTNTTVIVPVPVPGIPGFFLPVPIPKPTFITGVAAGQTLVGLDARTSTGELYALGYNPSPEVGSSNAQLYVLNVLTGIAKPTGSPIFLDLGNTDRIGFDFNPTLDRIRVVSALTQANYAVDPITGAATKQTNLHYAAGDPNATAMPQPGVGTVAYFNSYPGSTATTLFDIDELSSKGTNYANSGIFSIQAPPTDGTLTTLATGPVLKFENRNIGPVTAVDLDIYFNPQTSLNQGYVVEVTPDAVAIDPTADPTDKRHDSNFYRLNFVQNTDGTVSSDGKATLVANTISKSIPFEIRDIAAGIAPPPLTWDGSESTQWNNAQNWTPAFVPTATSDVIIPGDTPPNAPTVSDAEQARAVTLTTGAVLTTATGGTLSVFGNFTNNGGAVAGTGSGVIALAGPTSQTIGGSAATTFFNLSVGANGATLGTSGAIKRLLTLDGNLTTGSGQALTLLSTVSGDVTEQGQVVNNGTAKLVGSAIVQRAIDGSLNTQNIGYRHYSSPVTATNVSDLNSVTGHGFGASLTQSYNDATNLTPRATSPFPNVFGYDQNRLTTSQATDYTSTFDKGFFVPSDAFGDGSNPHAGLQPGRGYAVNIADDVTVDFTGQLTNGPLTVGGLRHDADPRAGYHLLGNPYPSALDWDKLTRNQLESSVYVFKSTGQYAGFYTSYNNSKGVNSGTHVLPLGQGFFVRALPDATTASLTFDNTARLTTYDATPFQRGTATADERPTLTLALRNAVGRGEQTMIYFEAGATPAYEAAFDAHHLPSPGAPLSLATAGSLSISGQPALSGADVTVPLELSATATGPYTLAVDALTNLPTRYHAFLRDALTGTATALTAQSRFALSLPAGGPATGRYAVVFTTQAQVLATAPAALAQLAGVYPNPAHGTASLVLPAALRGGQATPVQVVNSLGQVVLRRTLAAGAGTPLELPLTGLAAGIYTVRAQTALGQVVKRLTVE